MYMILTQNDLKKLKEVVHFELQRSVDDLRTEIFREIERNNLDMKNELTKVNKYNKEELKSFIERINAKIKEKLRDETNTLDSKTTSELENIRYEIRQVLDDNTRELSAIEELMNRYVQNYKDIMEISLQEVQETSTRSAY
jgi:flagellar hook-basal body complex protein FliE